MNQILWKLSDAGAHDAVTVLLEYPTDSGGLPEQEGRLSAPQFIERVEVYAEARKLVTLRLNRWSSRFGVYRILLPKLQPGVPMRVIAIDHQGTRLETPGEARYGAYRRV